MKFKLLKLFNKKLISRILFYGHLTFGFLILSLVSLYWNVSHLKVAFIWSIIFFILVVFKIMNEKEPADKEM